MENTQHRRRPALVAGVGLLLMAVLAGLANFVGIEGLVTEGDVDRTAHDVLASAGLFRLSIAALVVVVVLDVVVAWGLFEFFGTVDPGLSRLAAWFRVAYAAVFAVAISHLAGALHLLGGADYLNSFDAHQLQTEALVEINAFHDVWNLALVLFGVHLALIGYLAWISGPVPRMIGALLVVAGLGYLADSFGSLLLEHYTLSIGSVTFVGEVLLLLWLLARGGRDPAAIGSAPSRPVESVHR